MMDIVDVISTKRLIIRPYRQEDAPFLYEKLGKDPSSYRYTDFNPYESEQMAEGIVRERMLSFDKTGAIDRIIEYEGQIAGTLSAFDYDEEKKSLELGYAIVKEYRGQGFAKEAGRAFVEYLFKERGICGLHAWTHEENQASIRVLLALSFSCQGRIPDGFTEADGSFRDQLVYGLLSGDVTGD